MQKVAGKPLAIIILNWNNYEYSANCINSILQYGDPSVFDILLVDNHSTDTSFAQLQQQFPSLTFLDNPDNLGYAGGNNRGLRFSLEEGYRYTLVLNNDTLATSDFISPLLNFLDNHAEAAAVQPEIFMLHNPSRIWNAGSYYSSFPGRTYTRGYGKKDQKRYHSPAKTDWVTGCCFMVRNEVLHQTGLFNERFFLYYEDTDLSFRIRKAGYDLYYVPASSLLHAAGISGKTGGKKADGYLHPDVHYYNVRNKFWLLRRYTPWYYCVPVILFQLGGILVYLVYFIARRRLTKARRFLNGIYDGCFCSGYKNSL